MRIFVRIMVLAFALLGSGAQAGQKGGPARTSDDRPTLNFSVIELQHLPAPKSHVLFDRVLTDFAVLREGDDASLKRIMKPGAQFRWEAPSGTVVDPSGLLQAIRDNCTKPYEYDEGSYWVQISWICDESPGTALSAFKTFHNSPELTATIWFERNQIKDVVLMEPIAIPMQPHVRFGTYSELMGKK